MIDFKNKKIIVNYSKHRNDEYIFSPNCNVLFFFFLINTVSFIQEQNKAEFNTSLRTRVKYKLRRVKLKKKKKRILDKYWGKK